MTSPSTLPADLVTGAIEHMNSDHADNVLEYARWLAGLPWAEQAVITSIDAGGFELRATAGDHSETARLAFDMPVTDGHSLRAALVRLARLARERSGESHG